ncbi:hypothetical protein IWZ00DRAFT_543947 [Phyllosticta capitalensis]|uniref:uncharacterized protein n=1 Tax=Phyllosticta capitalensis TaxID=121624 RepID=UPI00312F1C12
MDEATARAVLKKLDDCIGTMQSSNTKMLETISENLKNVAEMEAIKSMVKKSLRRKASDGDKTLSEEAQLSPTPSRDTSISSIDSDGSVMEMDIDMFENDEDAEDAEDYEDYEDAGESTTMVAQPPHAGKTIIAPLTPYGTKLRLFLLHPGDRKIEDEEFERRFPELWTESLSQISDLTKLTYWKSWINPKTRSCMHSYIKLRVPAREVRWSDEHPHHEPCVHCIESNRQCIVLDDEGKEMVVLPRVTATAPEE